MQKEHTTLERLFPDLTPEQQREVEKVFDRYLEFVLRTYERITEDPHLYEEFLSLTVPAPGHTIGSTGRSFTSKYHDTDV